MGLIYDSGDSNRLKKALSANLSEAQAVLVALRSASIQLVARVDGGELSGKAYTSVNTLFSQGIMPKITVQLSQLESIQKDLDSYTREDSKVSRFGVLKEDELTVQLKATTAQRDTTQRLIDVNRSIATAATVVPTLGEALQAVNRQLDAVLSQLENDIRELEDELRALREFDAATRGLFQNNLTNSAVTSPSRAAAAGSSVGGGKGVAKTVLDALANLTGAELAAYAAAHPDLATMLAALGPKAISAWWKGLGADARKTIVGAIPQIIGNLDGIAYRDRSTANIAAMKAMKKTLLTIGPNDPGYDAAQKKLAAIAAIIKALGPHPEKARPVRQLVLLDFNSGDQPQVAISLGDLDKADHITENLPGMDMTVTKDIGGWTGASFNLYKEQFYLAKKAHGSTNLAVVSFLYDTPKGGEVAFADKAQAGGALLAAQLRGINAVRGWPDQDPRLSVVGFSYGSTTAVEAVKQASAGSLVMVGSAGIMLSSAIPMFTSVDELNIPHGHVYSGQSSQDSTATLGRVGSTRLDPTQVGATAFPTDDSTAPDGTHLNGTTDHTATVHSTDPDKYGYYDKATSALRNIAAETMGLPEEVSK